MAALAFGDEIIGELAEAVAAEANARAPVIEEVQPVNSTQSLRRGPNKHGEANDGREGPIKGSIFAQKSTKVLGTWLVDSPAWYSHFVEYGTLDHIIASRLGKKLSFPGTHEWAGLQVTVGVVDHPGANAHPYLRPSADKADEFLKAILASKGWRK